MLTLSLTFGATSQTTTDTVCVEVKTWRAVIADLEKGKANKKVIQQMDSVIKIWEARGANWDSARIEFQNQKNLLTSLYQNEVKINRLHEEKEGIYEKWIKDTKKSKFGHYLIGGGFGALLGILLGIFLK